MIKSMTGFASLTRENEEMQLTITVKSVNHRYLDLQIRAPNALTEIESRLRSVVQSRAARGRVELGVTLQLKVPPGVSLELNEPLMDALSHAAATARGQGWVETGLTAGDLLRFPQVVSVKEDPADDAVWNEACEAVVAATDEALVALDEMRRKEGEFLQRDLEERAATLSALVDGIVTESKEGDKALRERLLARVAEIEEQIEVEPVLVAQEVMRWVTRSDIHEEVARLRGHLEHMEQLSGEPAPCGRKLDFLIQEMNREVNTSGSKAEGRGMAELVVAAKAEVEKLREQVQNVE
jgi:uncharacterized protein (TIGR00255 family)